MRVLHVTPWFLPESVGGTEVYVAALARAMMAAGDEVLVAVASESTGRRDHDGIAVEAARAQDAGALLERWRPGLVHCHPLTGAELLPWMKAAHERGVPVVCTYHTPTLTCGRGDLQLFGATPCDGLMDVSRCAPCVMQDKGLPVALAPAVMRLAPASGDTPAWMPRRARSLLAIPAQRAQALRTWGEVRACVDQWVAPAQWVREVLRINGVAEARITLSRQGHAHPAGAVSRMPRGDRTPVAGYLGRIHPHKGLEVLLDAVQRVPRAQLEVRVAGSGAPGYEAYLRGRYPDDRIRWMGKLRPEATHDFLGTLDVLVVPSLLRETGPMTVLEAWDAGTPVIGSAGGGIGEWIAEFGGGLTFAQGDAAALAVRLEAFASGALELPPAPSATRTMTDVGAEMRGLYARTLDAGHA